MVDSARVVAEVGQTEGNVGDSLAGLTGQRGAVHRPRVGEGQVRRGHVAREVHASAYLEGRRAVGNGRLARSH